MVGLIREYSNGDYTYVNHNAGLGRIPNMPNIDQKKLCISVIERFIKNPKKNIKKILQKCLWSKSIKKKDSRHIFKKYLKEAPLSYMESDPQKIGNCSVYSPLKMHENILGSHLYTKFDQYLHDVSPKNAYQDNLEAQKLLSDIKKQNFTNKNGSISKIKQLIHLDQSKDIKLSKEIKSQLSEISKEIDCTSQFKPLSEHLSYKAKLKQQYSQLQKLISRETISEPKKGFSR